MFTKQHPHARLNDRGCPLLLQPEPKGVQPVQQLRRSFVPQLVRSKYELGTLRLDGLEHPQPKGCLILLYLDLVQDSLF